MFACENDDGRWAPIDDMRMAAAFGNGSREKNTSTTFRSLVTSSCMVSKCVCVCARVQCYSTQSTSTLLYPFGEWLRVVVSGAIIISVPAYYNIIIEYTENFRLTEANGRTNLLCYSECSWYFQVSFNSTIRVSFTWKRILSGTETYQLFAFCGFLLDTISAKLRLPCSNHRWRTSAQTHCTLQADNVCTI